jgi:hypothetical protein
MKMLDENDARDGLAEIPVARDKLCRQVYFAELLKR